MPYYTFANKETGETVEHFLSFKEHDEFIKNNPHMEQVPAAPPIGDPMRLGRVKPPDSHREVMNHIKKGHRGNTIDVW